MATIQTKITNTALKELSAGDVLRDTELKGLMARKATDGTVTFMFEFRERATGKQHRRKFGTADTMTATQARAEAQAMKAAAQKGETVGAPTPAQRGTVTLGACVEDWLDYVAARRRPATAKTYRTLMTNLTNAPIARTPVDAIARRHLVAVIDDTNARSPSAGAGLYRTIKSFLSWADARGHMDVTLPRANQIVTTPKPRAVVLTDDQIRDAWIRADSMRALTRDAWRLVLATGLRTGAAQQITADMISAPTDNGDIMITLPGAIMKSGRAFTVPVCGAIVTMIPSLQDPEPGHLFGASGTRLNNALTRYRAEYGISDMQLHDVRRSLRTFAAARGMGRDAGEAALDHAVVRDGLEAVYNQHDYAADGHRVILAWQSHIIGLINPADNVVALENRA